MRGVCSCKTPESHRKSPEDLPCYDTQQGGSYYDRVVREFKIGQYVRIAERYVMGNHSEPDAFTGRVGVVVWFDERAFVTFDPDQVKALNLLKDMPEEQRHYGSSIKHLATEFWPARLDVSNARSVS